MVTRASTRVILANTMLNRESCIRRGDQCLSLQTVAAGLRARGFRGEIVFFPAQENYYLPALMSQPDLIAPELDGLVDSNRRNLIGLSAVTDHFDAFGIVSGVMRDRYADVPRVGGGPLFMRQRNLVDARGRRYRDPIEIALQEGWVDAAIDGHTDPFGPLVVDHNCDISRATERGLYRLERGEVVGRGVGAYPHLDEIPHVTVVDQSESFKGIETFRVMFEALCRNACRYCTSNRGASGFSEAQVVNFLRAIRKRVGSNPLSMMEIEDSRPLALRELIKGKGWELLEVMAEFERDNENYPNVYKRIYMDPSDLVEAMGNGYQHYSEMVGALVDLGFLNFFFGRETPSADVAAKIGRRYATVNGAEIRDAERLAAERQQLEVFIKVLKLLRAEREYPQKILTSSVTVSYIVSPFETPASIEAMLGEARDLMKLSDDLVTVSATFSPLIPYPGTPLQRDYVDLLVDPERLDFYNCFANPWSESLGANAALLDVLTSVRFIGPAGMMKQRGNPGAGFDLLESIAEECFNGDIQPEPNSDRKKSYVVGVPLT